MALNANKKERDEAKAKAKAEALEQERKAKLSTLDTKGLTFEEIQDLINEATK